MTPLVQQDPAHPRRSRRWVATVGALLALTVVAYAYSLWHSRGVADNSPDSPGVEGQVGVPFESHRPGPTPDAFSVRCELVTKSGGRGRASDVAAYDPVTAGLSAIPCAPAPRASGLPVTSDRVLLFESEPGATPYQRHHHRSPPALHFDDPQVRVWLPRERLSPAARVVITLATADLASPGRTP
jgi:hypothetical protein